ncbi:MAG: rRNA biogenesis protein rrp5 [Alyxoria varia]|nr:MAG: rRNA biogenesis protein rrp5 [Alyxoria varia]
MDSLSLGQIVVGKVTKTTQRGLVVQIKPDTEDEQPHLVGHVGLTEIADDYDEAVPHSTPKNKVVRAAIVELDPSKKKLSLTTRPSKILSSTLPVKDKFITNISQLRVNDVVRGFIRNVADVGLFVGIGPGVTAFVRICDLSDSFLKDWKPHFEVHTLVKGKIIMVDEATKQVQMSLKDSVLSQKYETPITINDIKPGQIVKGKVRKVVDYGAFIVIDNSHNVSGLCHRKEMADRRVEDATKLYSEGDRVKAIIRRIDHKKTPARINFGLKASYFKDMEDSSDEDEDMENAVEVNESDFDEDMDSDGAIEMDEESATSGSSSDGDEDQEDQEDQKDEEQHEKKEPRRKKRQADRDEDDEEGLEVGGFDWTGSVRLPGGAPNTGHDRNPVSAADSRPKKKRRRNSSDPPEILQDNTDLDKHGLRTPSDFERHLLSQKHSTWLWTQYIAYHLEVSQVPEARAIAERALREIPIRLQAEKLDIWTFYMNLEINYGDDDHLEDVFARACQYSDGREVHLRRAAGHIDARQTEKALKVYQAMTGKKQFTADPAFWTKYARFLFDKIDPPDPAGARKLYARAKQSVPAELLRDLFLGFALLEFNCSNGDAERGRTMFEGLFDTYPGRWDHWDVLIDLEKSRLEKMKNPVAATGQSNRNNTVKGASNNPEDIKAQESQITRLYERLGNAALASVDILAPTTNAPSASSSAAASIQQTDGAGGSSERKGKKLKPKKARQNFKAWLEWEEDGKRGGNEKERANENKKWIEKVKARWSTYDDRLVETRPGKAKAAGIKVNK